MSDEREKIEVEGAEDEPSRVDDEDFEGHRMDVGAWTSVRVDVGAVDVGAVDVGRSTSADRSTVGGDAGWSVREAGIRRSGPAADPPPAAGADP